MLSFPFNSSTTVFYYNKDAFEKAGLDPEPRAADLARSRGRGGQAQGVGRTPCAFTTGWQSWVQLESFSRLAQRAVRAPRRTASPASTPKLVFNGPLQVRHIENMQDWVEEGLLHLRRPQERARGQVLQRRVRDDDDVVGRLRQRSSRTPSSSSPCRTLPYYADVAGRAAEHDHRRRDPVGDGRQEEGGVQGRRQVLHVPVAAGASRREWHQATGYLPITMAAYELTKKSGFYEKNPGTDVSVKQMIVKTTDNSRGVRARQLRRRSATSSTRSSRPSGPARRPRRRRSTTRSSAATSSSTQFDKTAQGAERRWPHARRRRIAAGRPLRAERLASPAPQSPTPMEKRARLPVALAAVRADRAADRDHARLLLLAGGAGGLPVAAASQDAFGAQHCSSSGSTISASCSTTSDYLASFRVTAVFSRAGRRARACRSRWCSRCSPTASSAARPSTRRC